jgi:hypothetical protein
MSPHQVRRNEECGRVGWRVGDRVRRQDTNVTGSIIENGAWLKVKWDDGATSYYRAHKAANIKLV